MMTRWLTRYHDYCGTHFNDNTFQHIFYFCSKWYVTAGEHCWNCSKWYVRHIITIASTVLCDYLYNNLDHVQVIMVILAKARRNSAIVIPITNSCQNHVFVEDIVVFPLYLSKCFKRKNHGVSLFLIWLSSIYTNIPMLDLCVQFNLTEKQINSIHVYGCANFKRK